MHGTETTLGHDFKFSCIHPNNICNMSRISPEPYFHSTNSPLRTRTIQICHRPLWAKNTIPYFIWYTHLTENIFTRKDLYWHINLTQLKNIFSELCEYSEYRISRAGFLNKVNRLSESNFRAFQNLVDEHSVEGAPTSLYNLTKSVPDPLSMFQRGILW